MEGSASTQSYTTSARGTPGYRAPELLKEPASFTNKVDIWSLGCIFYELVTGSQLFKNDVHVFEYCYEQVSPQVKCLEMYDPKFSDVVTVIIRELLTVKPFERPSVDELHSKFSDHYQGGARRVPESITSSRVSAVFSNKDDATIALEQLWPYGTDTQWRWLITESEIKAWEERTEISCTGNSPIAWATPDEPGEAVEFKRMEGVGWDADKSAIRVIKEGMHIYEVLTNLQNSRMLVIYGNRETTSLKLFSTISGKILFAGRSYTKLETKPFSKFSGNGNYLIMFRDRCYVDLIDSFKGQIQNTIHLKFRSELPNLWSLINGMALSKSKKLAIHVRVDKARRGARLTQEYVADEVTTETSVLVVMSAEECPTMEYFPNGRRFMVVVDSTPYCFDLKTLSLIQTFPSRSGFEFESLSHHFDRKNQAYLLAICRSNVKSMNVSEAECVSNAVIYGSNGEVIEIKNGLSVGSSPVSTVFNSTTINRRAVTATNLFILEADARSAWIIAAVGEFASKVAMLKPPDGPVSQQNDVSGLAVMAEIISLLKEDGTLVRFRNFVP